MKSSALLTGFALLALALPCSAQEPALPSAPPSLPQELAAPPAPLDTTQPLLVVEPTLVGNPVTPPEYPHVWIDAQYLLWKLKPNNITVPLVTTTTVQEDLATNILSGGLNDPNTVVLFGNQEFQRSTHSGGRLTLGGALDAEASEAFEASAMYLPLQISRFNAVSNDANGNPTLALPFNAVFPTPATETSGIVAGLFNGALLRGSVTIDNGTELWGGEINYVKMVCNGCLGELDMICGVRYQYLRDYLTIDAVTATADGGGSTHDDFQGVNSFYGGQLGLRYLLNLGNLHLAATGKVALGDTREALDISGTSVLPATVPPNTLPGGFYTASSNIGRTTHDRLGYITEFGGTVGYQLTDNVQFTVGYTYLYWNSVYRSGNQIDRNLNPSLNPAFTSNTIAGGTAVPARLNAESSFWAQGIDVGLRFSY